MENLIITIGRQLGSGGKEIAEKLGERLNIKVYDKTLLEVAAKESGLDAAIFETADEQEHSSFFGGLFSIHGSMGDYMPMSNCIENDNLFEIQSETIRGLAERESCIIVGRCAEYVLRDYPDMISIFITANNDDRISRTMEIENLEREKAVEFIEKGDKRRRSYHDYYASTHWGEARSYDICVNSSKLGINGTIELLYNLIKSRFEL